MKRIISVMLLCSVMLTIIPIIQVSATDAVADTSVFLKQNTSYTCTLSSAAMMLRRRAYLEGNNNWSSITENAIKATAWAPGLYNSFKYAGISVLSGKFTGTASQKKSQLISMLNSHPEGIVIYMYGDGLKTHAILATDYDSLTDTVYCADPANSIAKGRIPLMSAYLTGNTQNARIGNLKKYWYISSGNCVLSTPVATPKPQVHTHAYSYANDTTHPHSQYKYCSCGDKEYMGSKQLISTCTQCYPVGNVSLTRSFEKTKGKAVFYRNNVSNADKYTLKLYKDGNPYDTYTMSSTEYSIRGLTSGKYTATLYAKNTSTGQERSNSCSSFKIADTYTVSYNANGGSNAPSNQTKIEDETLTLTSLTPKREHYIFKGWAKSKKAVEPQYQPGDAYTKNTKITLHAVWEPETYDIKFDANGGKGDLEDVTITYGNTIRMPNTLVQDYYYLKGWSADKNSTTPEYKLGVDYKLTADTTLYAIWGQSTWNNEVSSSLTGEGTKENPYQIGTAADLAYLANKVNSQTTALAYEHYILTDNINLVYSEWVPIGLFGNENQYFYGSFDGNGYTISDLYITQENAGNIGLFGYVKNSEIKNLNLTGAIESISSTSTLNIGGVVGKAENTTLEKLSAMYFNIGSITAGATDYSNMGTVAGYVSDGNITDCSSKECHIDLKSGKFITGMLAGCCEANITNCSVSVSEDGLFSSQATVNAFQMGGLCGTLTKTAEKCTVEAPYMSNNVKTTASTYVGGLVGNLSGEVKICTVKFTDENANSMTMSGTGSTYVGGLAGYSESSAKITDCKFDGNTINSETTSGTTAVGGLIGQATAKVNPTVAVNGGQALSRETLPTKEGYTATWYTDANYTTPYDFSQTVTGDMTFYARWEEGDYTPDIWDGTSKEPAYNANTKTYTITNGEELAWISDVSNGRITTGTNFPTDITFSGYTIELANDIYLNDISDWENWETAPPTNEWKPICRIDGNFDGKKHRILGMYHICSDLACCIKNGNRRTGFFREVFGTVQNLGIINSYINSGDGNYSAYAHIGGIVGVNGGKISNSYNGATIIGNDRNAGGIAGGIVAVNDTNASIENCFNFGIIRGAYVGGIYGEIASAVLKEGCRVSNCYNVGQLTAIRGTAGGIASDAGGIIIENCYNMSKIDSDVIYGIASKIRTEVWTNDSHVDVTIRNCYANNSKLYSVVEGADSDHITISNTDTKTNEELRNLNLGSSIWGNDSNVNNGYPYLLSNYVCQITIGDNTTINRSFANIDGGLTGTASLNSYVGGVIGYGYGTTNSASVAQNMITIADSISATTTGSSNKAYSGNIIGQNNGSKFAFDNAYYNSEMSVESSTSTIDTTGVARSEKTINVAFLTNILGLTQYTSLDNLKNDKSAVWVLKNGELPELYYNCLNDITISEDIEKGSISLDKSQAVDGEIVTVTATPEDGYVLNKVYVNGVETVGTTFEISGNSEVYATFAEEIPEYTVSITAEENASASLTNLDVAETAEISLMSTEGFTANDGEEIQVDTTADTDYTVDAIYVNGEEIAGDSFIITDNSVVTMDVTSISTEYSAVTNDAEDIDVYSAKVSGSVADFEGALRYIEYWESDNPAEVYTTEVQEGSGEYSIELIGLLSNTEYSYRMTENGEIKTFTTLADGDGGETGGTEENIEPITTTTYEESDSAYVFSIICSQTLNNRKLIVAAYGEKDILVDYAEVVCDGRSEYATSIPINNGIKYFRVFTWSDAEKIEPMGISEMVEMY